MEKGQAIKEVMELVALVRRQSLALGKHGEKIASIERELAEAACTRTDKAIESKLREITDEAHQAGYEAGWAEADEAMSWDRSM